MKPTPIYEVNPNPMRLFEKWYQPWTSIADSEPVLGGDLGGTVGFRSSPLVFICLPLVLGWEKQRNHRFIHQPIKSFNPRWDYNYHHIRTMNMVYKVYITQSLLKGLYNMAYVT